jgi:hypothetical protein
MVRRLKRALYAWFYNLVLNALKVAILVGTGIAIGMSLH